MPSSVTRRSQLLSLLTEACEIEHGLACAYLYAAFSLKQELSEGGITWQQLQKIRLWAAQLYFIASQEMLHLAQVWDLQSAIGGTPYYLRPNFPLPSKYYPLNLPLRLERFSLGTLDRFIQFERPADVIIHPEGELVALESLPRFKTVGELYALIADGFRTIPDLFVGDRLRQVDGDTVDFPDLIRVSSTEDAIRAVQLITRQGEGIEHEHQDCHFSIFREVRRQYLLELADAERSAVPFEPVRPSISNPTPGPDVGALGAQPISDSRTANVADCFDSIYGQMLRMLQYVFDGATAHPVVLRAFGSGAIEAMTAVIKPLGEALSCMPAGAEYEAQTAGAPFTLSRHVALPTEPNAALTVVAERLEELDARLRDLASGAQTERQLQTASLNFHVLSQRFQQLASSMKAETVS